MRQILNTVWFNCWWQYISISVKFRTCSYPSERTLKTANKHLNTTQRVETVWFNCWRTNRTVYFNLWEHSNGSGSLKMHKRCNNTPGYDRLIKQTLFLKAYLSLLPCESFQAPFCADKWKMNRKTMHHSYIVKIWVTIYILSAWNGCITSIHTFFCLLTKP